MSDAHLDVLGIGNAIVDILAKCEDSFLAERGLSKGHMTLIDTQQAEDLYSVMGPAVENSGGSAANTMAGLASFGGSAAFIGRVADDQLGKIFAHDLRAIGVEYDTAPISDGTPTARCFILVSPDGERTMSTYLGASVELGPSELHAGFIDRAKVTYLEGYLFDPPLAQEAFHQAAHETARTGGEVALSLSDAFCVERHRGAFQSFIEGGVDILFANEEEICSLYEVGYFNEAVEEVRKQCKLAALTRGAQGSVVVTPDHLYEVPADSVDTVVDTTGAGDLYAAGFLYGYVKGKDPETCAKLGGLAAGEIISHMGARPETSLADLAKARGLID